MVIAPCGLIAQSGAYSHYWGNPHAFWETVASFTARRCSGALVVYHGLALATHGATMGAPALAGERARSSRCCHYGLAPLYLGGHLNACSY